MIPVTVDIVSDVRQVAECHAFGVGIERGFIRHEGGGLQRIEITVLHQHRNADARAAGERGVQTRSKQIDELSARLHRWAQVVLLEIEEVGIRRRHVIEKEGPELL